MSLVTCGGVDVVDGRIHLPQRRWWWARLRVDTQTTPSGQVTIDALNGLSLSGTIVSSLSGIYLDSAYVQVVGGAGGLNNLLSPAAFQNATVFDVLNAIVTGVGEQVSSTVDPALGSTLLSFWTLTAQTAASALDALTEAAGADTWRVLDDGTVWLGVESWTSQDLPSTTTIMQQFPDEGRWELGCDTPALLPGVNVSDLGANIGAVDHWISADKIRSWAWNA